MFFLDFVVVYSRVDLSVHILFHFYIDLIDLITMNAFYFKVAIVLIRNDEIMKFDQWNLYKYPIVIICVWNLRP